MLIIRKSIVYHSCRLEIRQVQLFSQLMPTSDMAGAAPKSIFGVQDDMSKQQACLASLTCLAQQGVRCRD
jgi:hypothetical protein